VRAVVFKGPGKMAVEDVDDPRIEKPGDALLEVTSTAICGSDLHMYEGRTAMEEGNVFGHEIMGVIREVGQGVVSIRPGDRVVLPFNIACGFCFNCERGDFHACLTANPEVAHAAYGYAGMGPFRGGQAEYVRVPFADVNCLKLPGEPGDDLEDDFILLADVFPTGFHGAELTRVGPGDSVAVFGAGPVGQMAAYSSILRGAAEVYVVDDVRSRLELAESIGAIPIDFGEGDPVEQIKEHRRGATSSAWRKGEEKMDGVLCSIEAVGYQARSADRPNQENPTQTLEWIAGVTNATGRVGIVGVFVAPDPGADDDEAKEGVFQVPLASFFEKALSIGMGQCPVKRYNVFLRHLIQTGRAKPSFLVSHREPLDAAPEAYEHFDRREPGWHKVVLKPTQQAA
jgi:glutathione-independent formaldehyde dehydrogenase